MSEPEYRVATVLLVVGAAGLGAVSVGCDDGPSEQTAQPMPATSGGESGAVAASRGDESSQKHFSTRIEPERIERATTSEVTFEIRPDDGLKINEEYPSWSLELEVPEGVELSTRSFDREDFELEKGRAVVAADMSVAEQGPAEVTGTANFSVCNDKTCHILRDEPVTFRVEATGEGDSEANPEGEGRNGR